MTNHPESSIGPLVDLLGARCERWWYPADALGIRCNGPLQVYANTRPPRQAICSRCGHVSYEVPLTEEAA